MQAIESIKAGNAAQALKQLQAEVRARPGDAKLRTFLFQLLAVLGQWPRALAQLNVVGELDPLSTLMVGTYSQLLQCEALRSEVFAGQRSPKVIGEPEQWLALMLQALKLDAEDHHAEAASLRDQAFEAATPVSGSIDGVRFEWLADADPRFGPCLEVMLNGGYSWVPFSRIKQLKFDPPTDLRDQIWTAVNIIWVNDGQAVGFVPSRYPGSERAEDGALALARKTEWQDVGGEIFFGLGQRMLATDDGEYPLMDVRLIQFDHPSTEG